MTLSRYLRLPIIVTSALLIPITASAQAKLRIAVFPFDDRTTANKDMNIGTKMADFLIAQLAGSETFTVLDRQYVDRILAEKNLKYDPNYDSASAAKSGLMGTVDLVVSGQIGAFNANSNESRKNAILYTEYTKTGVVELKATARFISVEKGSIVAAPSAHAEQTKVLATNKVYHVKPGQDIGTSGNDTSSEQALRKLVDEAAEEVAKQLSTQVEQSAANLPPPVPAAQPAAKSPELPKATPPETPKTVPLPSSGAPMFVGIEDGLVYINKGSDSGFKQGDILLVTRAVTTTMKNPETQQFVVRHETVCKLTLTTVEKALAAGKCIPDAAHTKTGRTPREGDEVASVSK